MLVGCSTHACGCWTRGQRVQVLPCVRREARQCSKGFKRCWCLLTLGALGLPPLAAADAAAAACLGGAVFILRLRVPLRSSWASWGRNLRSTATDRSRLVTCTQQSGSRRERGESRGDNARSQCKDQITAELMCCCADQLLDQSAGLLIGWSSSGR